jgi:hypothetical protein
MNNELLLSVHELPAKYRMVTRALLEKNEGPGIHFMGTFVTVRSIIIV